MLDQRDVHQQLTAGTAAPAAGRTTATGAWRALKPTVKLNFQERV
jgi:hypothetical protein